MELLLGEGTGLEAIVLVFGEDGGLERMVARCNSALFRKLRTESIAVDVCLLPTVVKSKLFTALTRVSTLLFILGVGMLGIMGSRVGVAGLLDTYTTPG